MCVVVPDTVMVRTHTQAMGLQRALVLSYLLFLTGTSEELRTACLPSTMGHGHDAERKKSSFLI